MNRLSLNSRLYDFETATPIPTYLARSKDVANGFTALVPGNLGLSGRSRSGSDASSLAPLSPKPQCRHRQARAIRLAHVALLVHHPAHGRGIFPQSAPRSGVGHHNHPGDSHAHR